MKMVRCSFLNGTFLIVLFNIGCVISYEEKSVYTQAHLTITYNNAPPDHEDGNEKSFTGKYGKQSPKATASGILYYGKDETWCKPLKQLPPLMKSEWIPLIPMATNCSIKDQIKLAQDYNATAVIIYNYQPVKEPVLLDDESPATISVVISQRTGKELIEILNNYHGVKCKIAVGTHYIDRKWQVSRTSVLFVLVSFILLMCISLAWLVFYYVQRFRHIYRNDRKEKQLLSAAKKAISKLKTIPFQSRTKDEEEDSCAICLECYKDGETLRVLPCRHEFHKSCIDPWLLNHRTCPMCKSNILKSLGVELPENINLSSYDSAARGLDEIIARSVSGIEPSSIDIYQPGVSTIHAWTEPSPNENLSVSSSNVSDTDSERSTAALVATVETV